MPSRTGARSLGLRGWCARSETSPAAAADGPAAGDLDPEERTEHSVEHDPIQETIV